MSAISSSGRRAAHPGMRMLRLALLALMRDGKSGELRVLLSALLVAVAAMTAVGFFTNRMNLAVDQQAGELLAADLRLQASQPLEQDCFKAAAAAGLRFAEAATFPSVAFKAEESALIAVHAVSDGYPLRGRLRIADEAFGPARETSRLPGKGEAWLESRLLAQLDARIGDRIEVGARGLTITQALEYRPDQSSQFVDLAPTLLMRLEDVPATGLLQEGSRISHAALFAGEPAAIAALKQQLESRGQSGQRILEPRDASPQISATIDRAGRFLNLAAVATLLLAAIAVAMAARRYVVRRLDVAALMKTMGAPQRLVLGISVLELLVIGLLAGVSGTLVGYAAQEGMAYLLKDLIRGELPPPSPGVGWLGVFGAMLVLVGFALPALLHLRQVPPARVLRGDLEPPPLRHLTPYGAALAVLVALLGWLLRDVLLLAHVLAASAAMCAILLLAGWALVGLLGRFRRKVGVAWRYGMANIVRRGRDSIVQIVAFGLGLMLLLLLMVVRHDLVRDWRASLSEDVPNYFLINIQPDRREALREFFEQRDLAPADLAPMIRARLLSINGVPAAAAVRSERGRDFLEREANLTWSAHMQADNILVEGRWWHEGDGGGPRVSVEIEMARALGLNVGDTLVFDVAGEPLGAQVASLRKVQWDSFQPNFFMVFSPGILDHSVGTYITSMHVRGEQRPLLVDFSRQFPEVTTIDVDALLRQVRQVMDKASLAIQCVFGFTLLAGVLVLLAAVQGTLDERRYESAVLRTLGASRRVVLLGVAAEFITLGLLAGLLAAIGASAAGYILATRVFDLDYGFSPATWGLGVLAGAVLVGLSGTLATRSVVNHPPAAMLRGE